MRLLLVGLLLLSGCVSVAPARAPLDQWRSFEGEVLAIVGAERECGPVSLRFEFCRNDIQEIPTVAEAALSEACRGQPAAYLDGFGRAPSDMQDRRTAAGALRQMFSAPPFGPLSETGLGWRGLLKIVHDRDQALRFFRPEVQVSNTAVLENSKWVAVCAHALFARSIVGDFLSQTSPEELAADEELANYAWLLVQHSDFDPRYQLTMSRWFGSVDAPHMQRHSAYLYDRSMIGLHRPQRFGTQLRCNHGVREPFPVEDPSGLDSRRGTLGLTPMGEHLATFPRPCPRPQPD